jgi:capsule polysaccharide export protein KpsC/LpsZ
VQKAYVYKTRKETLLTTVDFSTEDISKLRKKSHIIVDESGSKWKDDNDAILNYTSKDRKVHVRE